MGLCPSDGRAHGGRHRRPGRRDGRRRGPRHGRAAAAPPGGHRILAPERGRRADRLRPLGAHVVAVADRPTLPFAAASFDLVVSRHPVVVLWAEIARVLRPGGNYLSQQIGAGTNRELTDFMMGPQPPNASRSPGPTRAAAEAAGLEVQRPAGVRAAGRVLRRRRRRVLLAQGSLDGARLHARCLPRPTARHARADPARRQLRLDGSAPPGGGGPPRVSPGLSAGQLAWLTELML